MLWMKQFWNCVQSCFHHDFKVACNHVFTTTDNDEEAKTVLVGTYYPPHLQTVKRKLHTHTTNKKTKTKKHNSEPTSVYHVPALKGWWQISVDNVRCLLSLISIADDRLQWTAWEWTNLGLLSLLSTADDRSQWTSESAPISVFQPYSQQLSHVQSQRSEIHLFYKN